MATQQRPGFGSSLAVLAVQSLEETCDVSLVRATDEVAVIRGEPMERIW
jgi:hypothetical protein